MANVSHVLALALMATLLVCGCALDSKPASGMQNLVVQNAEELVVDAQPAKTEPLPNTAEPQINCTLAVKQAVIIAGEQIDMTLTSRFPGSARFDFVCGDEERHLISENSLELETKCKFNTPGTQNISVKANGRECANATVEVRKKAGGTCSIDNASIERDLAAFYYKWTVYFDGFSDGDTLTWVCGNTVSKKKLSSDPIWGMPRLDMLSCDFPGMPSVDYIDVSISGMPCGKISTR